jgi:hypothetical protein
VILVLPYFSQIRGRQLWGTDVYTDDSDIVAGNIDQHGYESIETPRLLFPCPNIIYMQILLLSQKEIFVKVLDLGFGTLTKCYLFVYLQLWVWWNAVLMHTGYYTPTATPPPHSVSELQATIQILPPQESALRPSVSYITIFDHAQTCVEIATVFCCV